MNFAQAGVPFIHCLESPKCMHGVSALAGFPRKQLRQVSAGCGGSWEMPLALAHQPREGLPCLGTGAAGWPCLPEERAPWQARWREKILLLCCLAAEKWG